MKTALLLKSLIFTIIGESFSSYVSFNAGKFEKQLFLCLFFKLFSVTAQMFCGTNSCMFTCACMLGHVTGSRLLQRLTVIFRADTD